MRASCRFGSRTFDAIVLNHSLEHFERLKPALQEIGRVVRPDGAIYVAVPDAATFKRPLNTAKSFEAAAVM